MKVEKAQKILSIILLTIMFITVIGNVFMVSATTPSEITASDGIATDTINDVGKRIVGILQTVGVVLSVIILIVIGIKYMMGSAEEKAEYKKTLMPYVIGAALIFTASMLAQILYDFFNGWTA